MDPHELQCLIKKSFKDLFSSDFECTRICVGYCVACFKSNRQRAQNVFFFKKRSKVALHQYRIRPAFLQQLMLSCENECTLSALCTKAHTRKFPVFTAMWHSEGHLAVLFYIFFHHKNVVFLCFMWCFGHLF